MPGTKLEDVKRVCSHPHALPQCHSFISAHDLEAIEVANTAIAAQNVQQKGDKSLCCHLLAGGGCALRSRYSRRGHQRHAAQRNTLYRRQQNADCQPEDNRIEIAFHIPNASGTLITVLDTIAHYGIDMTEIHSRPLKDSPWCYVFYVDFTGNMRAMRCSPCCISFMRSFPYIKSNRQLLRA